MESTMLYFGRGDWRSDTVEKKKSKAWIWKLCNQRAFSDLVFIMLFVSLDFCYNLAFVHFVSSSPICFLIPLPFSFDNHFKKSHSGSGFFVSWVFPTQRMPLNPLLSSTSSLLLFILFPFFQRPIVFTILDFK